MRQNMPDVNFSPVVVDGGNDTSLVPGDVKNGELPHLVSMRKNGSDLLNVGKGPPPHHGEPLSQAGFAVWVIRCEVVQPLSCDDVHRREDVTRPGWDKVLKSVFPARQPVQRVSCPAENGENSFPDRLFQPSRWADATRVAQNCRRNRRSFSTSMRMSGIFARFMARRSRPNPNANPVTVSGS